MKHRILPLLLSLTMILTIFSGMSVSATYTPKYTDYAEELYELGLFRGTGVNANSTPIFSLDSPATRLQALIMLIRLLGEEDAALESTAKNPFVDIPSTHYGDRYVAYAYEKGYTNGVNANKFGEANVTSQQYLTFVLRALGYDDTKGDFSYANAIDMAENIGLVAQGVYHNYDILLRDNCVKISYDALGQTLNGSNKTLKNKLIETGAVHIEKTDLTLATSGSKTTYYALGSTLKSVVSPILTLSKLELKETGGSRANINMMTDGVAQLAIVQSDVLAYGHTGSYSFAKYGAEDSALWIAGIYSDAIHILAKPGINTLNGLKGKKVCVGVEGSGTNLNAWQILNAVGITDRDITAVNGGALEGIAMLESGEIDAVFTVAGVPAASIVEYAQNHQLNLVSLSAEEIASVKAVCPFFNQVNIPVETYPKQNSPVDCVAIQAAIVADKSVSKNVVYELTKAIYENQSTLAEKHGKWQFLSVDSALENTSPLHPGAEKYYREIGAIQ